MHTICASGGMPQPCPQAPPPCVIQRRPHATSCPCSGTFHRSPEAPGHACSGLKQSWGRMNTFLQGPIWLAPEHRVLEAATCMCAGHGACGCWGGSRHASIRNYGESYEHQNCVIDTVFAHSIGRIGGSLDAAPSGGCCPVAYLARVARCYYRAQGSLQPHTPKKDCSALVTVPLYVASADGSLLRTHLGELTCLACSNDHFTSAVGMLRFHTQATTCEWL